MMALGSSKRCSTLPMMPRPLRTWLRQVGAVRGVGNAYPRRRLPSRVCWFTLGPEPRTGSSTRMLSAGVRCEPPLELDRVRLLDSEELRERLRHLELMTGIDEGAVDDLR